MNYQYKRPEGKLYKVSIRKWNKAFANRGRWPFVVAEVYLQEDKAVVQYVVSVSGKILFALLLPFIFVYCILAQGFPQTIKDLDGVFRDKKLGRFSSDMVYKHKNDSWGKLMKLIGADK